ncbi:MAG TPA: ABC transporter substrate-binding protein, partial [Halococcus sp.]|nr:ABC transporter substrate-binding protein [Halococcus sp.]
GVKRGMGRRRDAVGGRISRRAALKAGGAGVLSLSLAGCVGNRNAIPSLNPGSPDEINRGGVFTIGIPDPPVGLNPLTVSSEESFGIIDLLNGTGTAVDPVYFGVHPSVFSKWYEFQTDAPHAKPEIQFNLRSGLTFTDGTECTIEDVLFTYRYLLDKRPEKFASVLEPIVGIERASSNRWNLSLQLAEPVSTYDSEQLGIPILPKHVWKDVEDPESYRPTEHGGPVGLGAGKIKTDDPESEIEVAFREEYPLRDLDWIRAKDEFLQGGPFLDAIRYRVYEDDEALKQAFRRGEIDSIYDSYTADEIKPILDDGKSNTVLGSDEAYKSFAFNLRTTPLGDLPFRQVFGFAFDDHYWVHELNDGYVTEGDFVAPPGYTAVRPEHQNPALPPRADQDFLTGSSTNAFAFRTTKNGRVDVAGIRSFLTEGHLLAGNAGTYVGQYYPDSLTGVHATQTTPKYEYSFGPVTSAVLKDADTKMEVRVDGNTIPEINDGPLVLFTRPESEKPKEAKMTRRYIRALHRIGIPVKREEIGTEKLRERVFRQEDFDITPIDAEPISEFAIKSLYERFHSDNADDHAVAEIGTQKNTNRSLRNAMGYGVIDAASADALIEESLEEMSAEARNDLIRQTLERIYLDFPVMVVSYENLYWPADRRKFDGFLEKIPAPGSTYLPTQLVQLYRS